MGTPSISGRGGQDRVRRRHLKAEYNYRGRGGCCPLSANSISGVEGGGCAVRFRLIQSVGGGGGGGAIQQLYGNKLLVIMIHWLQ